MCRISWSRKTNTHRVLFLCIFGSKAFLVTQGFWCNCQKSRIYSGFWQWINNICKTLVQDFFRERLYTHLKFDLCNIHDHAWIYTQMMAVLLAAYSPRSYWSWPYDALTAGRLITAVWLAYVAVRGQSVTCHHMFCTWQFRKIPESRIAILNLSLW